MDEQGRRKHRIGRTYGEKTAYVSLNEHETEGYADCGCLVTRYDPAVYLCPMHQNAGEMLVALERVQEALKDYYAGESDWDTALERTVTEVIVRAKEGFHE